jgi:hypothetical protein
VGEIGETAVVQLMGDRDGTGRTISVLCENKVSFAGAGIVALERIRSV